MEKVLLKGLRGRSEETQRSLTFRKRERRQGVRVLLRQKSSDWEDGRSFPSRGRVFRETRDSSGSPDFGGHLKVRSDADSWSHEPRVGEDPGRGGPLRSHPAGLPDSYRLP